MGGSFEMKTELWLQREAAMATLTRDRSTGELHLNEVGLHLKEWVKCGGFLLKSIKNGVGQLWDGGNFRRGGSVSLPIISPPLRPYQLPAINCQPFFLPGKTRKPSPTSLQAKKNQKQKANPAG